MSWCKNCRNSCVVEDGQTCNQCRLADFEDYFDAAESRLLIARAKGLKTTNLSEAIKKL